MLEAAIVEAPDSLPAVGVSNGDSSVWIEALPARVYHTPQYGEVPITTEKLSRMVQNFNDRVRGQDVATDFDHGMDRSKGNQASGWYKEFAVKPSSNDPSQFSLWAKIDFTEDARKEISEQKWKYFSLEWDDEWVNNDGQPVQDVIIGGGLTNRPIAKNMMPVNFSETLWNELDADTQKAFAVWSTAFVNGLPDSSFLYVESGGKKDSEGKTSPRSLRHLPYKDGSGKIDLPHLRNAIARIPQMTGISDSLKSSLQARARRLLGGQKKASELSDDIALAVGVLMEAGFDVEFSEAAWEHSEPGTGPTPQFGGAQGQPDPGTGQYVPRVQGDPGQELDIKGGWRWEPLPASSTDPDQPVRQHPGMTSMSEGGNSIVTEEELVELKELLGVKDDEQFVPEARKAFGEIVALRASVGKSDQERQFSEQFPAVWREHQQLLESNRNTQARAFSESVQRIERPEGDQMVPTRNGLSGMALEKVAEVHKKFSEGSATIADFEDAVKTIVHGGIVEFGEIGSSVAKETPGVDATTASGIADARKMFAEKVAEIQSSDEMSFAEAIKEASRQYPELAAGYRATAAG
jgi:hypothetical protein